MHIMSMKSLKSLKCGLFSLGSKKRQQLRSVILTPVNAISIESHMVICVGKSSAD